MYRGDPLYPCGIHSRDPQGITEAADIGNPLAIAPYVHPLVFSWVLPMKCFLLLQVAVSIRTYSVMWAGCWQAAWMLEQNRWKINRKWKLSASC